MGMVPIEAHIKENYRLKKWSKHYPKREMTLEEKNNIFKHNLLT
jgi:hypothetical protein